LGSSWRLHCSRRANGQPDPAPLALRADEERALFGR
jgi:hypothetical protein